MKQFTTWIAATALAVLLGGCVTTGSGGSTGASSGSTGASSGSGVTVYGTVDAGVSRSNR